MARVAATAAVFASIDSRQPGHFRRGGVAVDAVAVLPSGSPLSDSGGSSWTLVPAASPRSRRGGSAEPLVPSRSQRNPSVAALLTSPGGTAQRRDLSPTRLDTPFVPPSYAPPKSSWAKAGGPLARASNDWPPQGAGGGGGARGGDGVRRGGGGGGGGSTPTRRGGGMPPSPGPNRRPGGASARGRSLGIAVVAAVGMAAGAARQATRLRRAPGAGFSLLRRAVASCAAVVRGASAALPAAPAAAFAVSPLVLAVAPALVVDLDAEAASPTGNARAPALPRMYEVREGDTLWGIALSAYGDGSRYADILAANPGLAEALSEAGSGLDAGALLRLPSP